MCDDDTKRTHPSTEWSTNVRLDEDENELRSIEKDEECEMTTIPFPLRIIGSVLHTLLMIRNE
jgi:hypothetical protein